MFLKNVNIMKNVIAQSMLFSFIFNMYSLIYFMSYCEKFVRIVDERQKKNSADNAQ